VFNNYFNDYMGFTSIPKGKLPLKFTMPDIKFYGTKHPLFLLSVMTLKGIEKDIFHIIFP